jgi:hypothetical protein
MKVGSKVTRQRSCLCAGACTSPVVTILIVAGIDTSLVLGCSVAAQDVDNVLRWATLSVIANDNV